MAISIKGSWLNIENKSWINVAHVDLFEIREEKGEEKWQVVAWNALQPQVEAYIISSHDTENAAQKALNSLIDKLAES